MSSAADVALAPSCLDGQSVEDRTGAALRNVVRWCDVIRVIGGAFGEHGVTVWQRPPAEGMRATTG